MPLPLPVIIAKNEIIQKVLQTFGHVRVKYPSFPQSSNKYHSLVYEDGDTRSNHGLRNVHALDMAIADPKFCNTAQESLLRLHYTHEEIRRMDEATVKSLLKETVDMTGSYEIFLSLFAKKNKVVIN